jgi:hypothetical protein
MKVVYQFFPELLSFTIINRNTFKLKQKVGTLYGKLIAVQKTQT